MQATEILQIPSSGVDKHCIMTEQITDRTAGKTVDDPRKLSALILRIADLAQSHSVGSAVIGISAPQGDLMFPELVDFLRSALRVEDGIFHMTRERAIVHLADLDLHGGEAVFSRILDDFVEEFPAAKEPAFVINYLQVNPGIENLSTRDVLTEIFPPRLLH